MEILRVIFSVYVCITADSYYEYLPLFQMRFKVSSFRLKIDVSKCLRYIIFQYAESVSKRW